MKKMFLLIFTSFCFMSFGLITNAACNDEELNRWADDVNIVFMEDADFTLTEEVPEGETPNVIEHKRKYAYVLLVYPEIDTVKAVVTNNLDDEKITARFQDEYNAITIGSYIHFNPKKYTIQLYGDTNSACPGELLKTVKYEVPSYNMYQLTGFCEDNPAEDICRVDNDTSDMTYEEFEKIVFDKEEQELLQKMNLLQKVWYYIKKYWYYVVIPVVIVSIFFIVKIIAYKKKVDKE